MNKTQGSTNAKVFIEKEKEGREGKEKQEKDNQK